MILRNSDALLYAAKARFSDVSSNFSQQLSFPMYNCYIESAYYPTGVGHIMPPLIMLPLLLFRLKISALPPGSGWTATHFPFSREVVTITWNFFRGRGGVLISLHFRIVKVAVLQSWDRGMGDIEPSIKIRTPVIPSQSAKFPHRCWYVDSD